MMATYRSRAHVEAVQVLNNEYADHPYAFRDTPEWLAEAIKNGVVTARFRGEDYWYLDVKDWDGTGGTAGPDDWITRDGSGHLRVVPANRFTALYESAA